MKKAFVVLPLLFLQACATPKQIMPDAHYKQFVLWFVVGERCAMNGKASADDIAYGNQQMRYRLNSYAYDPQRLQYEYNLANQLSDQPTPEQCNQMSLRIAEMRQQAELNAANARNQQQSMNDAVNALKQGAPTTTYCNRIGSQVLCNSY